MTWWFGALDLYSWLLSGSQQVISAYAFDQSVKEAVTSILGSTDSSSLNTKETCINANSVETKHEGLLKLDTAWSILYNDCLSALETCVEGELKHFHKARYMLAQGLYRRGESGDIERATDQLSFCFKSSRSSFTINMWEIDSMTKKGRYIFIINLSVIFSLVLLLVFFF